MSRGRRVTSSLPGACLKGPAADDDDAAVPTAAVSVAVVVPLRHHRVAAAGVAQLQQLWHQLLWQLLSQLWQQLLAPHPCQPHPRTAGLDPLKKAPNFNLVVTSLNATHFDKYTVHRRQLRLNLQ